jgi:ATP-dependent helicase/nuclease subunit A
VVKLSPQQQLAVEHQGGVLLSAGAGAGKTLTLVEHVVYLVRQFSEGKFSSSIDYQVALKKYLASIVIMTYTRKAAAEMILRIKKRFRQLSEESGGQSYWKFARECLSSLSAGTIHGFCLHLIKSGYFPHVSPLSQIVDEIHIGQRIKKLLRQWFQEKIDQNYLGRDAFDTIMVNENRIVESLTRVFGDPEIRNKWKNYNPQELASENLELFWQELIVVMDLADVANKKIDFSTLDKHQEKNWYLFLAGHQKLRDSLFGGKSESLQDYLQFLESFKSLRKPDQRLGLDSVSEFYQEVKTFRDFLLDHKDDLLAYSENFHQAFVPWSVLLKNAFDYIEQNYFYEPGVSFADLEYLCCLGLRDDSVRQKIQNDFDYFIVDEFQDTSRFQFDILKLLSGDNYQRLFIVGDQKQAIYSFRGGEVEMFRLCMQLMPRHYQLTDNYRSAKEIVSFNNDLFTNLLGKNFSYQDQSQDVTGERQTTPEPAGDRIPGKLYRLLADIGDMAEEEGEVGETKSTVAKLNYAESIVLVGQVEFMLQEYPGDKICLLYWKLNASVYILPLLSERNIAAIAQIKVPYQEDPIIGLLHVWSSFLLEWRQIESDKNPAEEPKLKNTCFKYLQLMIPSYLQLLHLSQAIDVEFLASEFQQQYKLLGLWAAFVNFIHTLKMANSNYPQNLQMLESFVESRGGNLDQVAADMSRIVSEDYSIEIQTSGKESIRLMTVHAAKGLEFDHVIVGGIHTNGQKRPENDYFGRHPASFKWKIRASQKRAFESPRFILEKLINARKEFSESQRLFYVACTRAKKTLSWVELSVNQKECSRSKDSWVVGLRSFWQRYPEQLRQYAITERQVLIAETLKSPRFDQLNNTPPLFHRDSLGLVMRVNGPGRDQMAIVSDLSVTRLVSLVECPRKFFLKNVCRFDEKCIKEYFPSPLLIINENNSHKELAEDLSWQEDEIILSAAERGTAIHHGISDWLQGKTASLPSEGAQWIVGLLRKFKETHHLISEQGIKFPFRGMMVSGTPDLVLVPCRAGEEFSIIDFKTGSQRTETENVYWAQLYTYGYALYRLRKIPLDRKVNLHLAYLDQQNFITRQVDYEQITRFWNELWPRVAHLWEMNLKHCSECSYRPICS